MKRRILPLMVLITVCMFLPAMAQETSPPEVYGLNVGNKMPFHVVDFIAGARNHGAGCPSVMAGKARSVEIWSRVEDDQTFHLACALEKKLDENRTKQGYLILFNSTPQKTILAQPDALKRFHVATPRDSTAKLFEKADPTTKAGSVVYLMNNKTITKTWTFAPGELKPEQIETIVKEFAAEK